MELAGIQYMGVGGATEPCVRSVMRYVQFGERIARAIILTSGNTHGMLLSDGVDAVAVKSGFGSGYVGEGSRGFSLVLQLLKENGAEIDEVEVPPEIIQRLDDSALSQADVKYIEKQRRVRPTRWYDYLFEQHYQGAKDGTLWQEFPPVVPFAVIDPRIMDLALAFWEAPDDKLHRSYRRLEDILRKRTKEDEYGTKLCSVAFLPPRGSLHWPGLDSGEQTGRVNMFVGAFGAYRNPRAHRELKERPDKQLAELLLVNQLYRMEREAESRRDQSNAALAASG